MEIAQEQISVAIKDEMRKSYMDYAMSVIIGRALPDVRDGLKPVHRRVLYAMHDLGNRHNKPYKKSARIVGDVIGKYHPHGESAVYDAIVRMEQNFSMRYPLIDGQGNFGSIDDDPPAAMRYTEIRMERIAEEMLADLEKETVDFLPNYDGTLSEPIVLPAKIPNLLINGSSGIAVGMATNIPPHNLREILDATIYMIRNPQATLVDLMTFVKGPDFPTAGTIYGWEGIRSAYESGRGIIQIRSKAEIEILQKNQQAIIVTELPYQVNKARLIERIAELVREKKVEGISDLRDESDREGMRIVIEVKNDYPAQVVLNTLYKLTPMQTSFGVIMLAIVHNQPKVLSLSEMLRCFISHRRDVVRRRSIFELAKAKARAHILEGLKKALDILDVVIELIRSSKEAAEARQRLVSELEFTEIQAQAILEMRLQRLTGLERGKILEELTETVRLIKELTSILSSEGRLSEVIIAELEAIRATYGDERRTRIEDQHADLLITDLIPNEQVVITVTYSGFIKRTPAATYRTQRRGGMGRTGMNTREEDFITNVFISTNHSYLLVFTTKGRVYWLRVYEIPEAAAQARGKAIVNLIQIEREEKITDIISVNDFEEGKFLIMCTRKGIVKKTALNAYANPRVAGIRAISVDEDDELLRVKMTEGNHDVLLGTHDGLAIRFPENEVRDVGRIARGVIGIDLSPGDKVVAMETFLDPGTLLSVTENGYGKRTSTEEYRRQGRGGKGIININTSERNGKVVGVCHLSSKSEVMLVTEQGKIIRLAASGITETVTRNAQGVRLINLEENDRLAAVTAFEGQENDSSSVDAEDNPAQSTEEA